MEYWTRRLNVRIAGNGSRTIVFGHGLGTEQSCWRRQIEALSDDYRVVTLDFPGATTETNAAFDPARHASLFGFAEDLALLMQELRVRGAIYLGHSMGGMAGILTANGCPGVFDAVITLGASARYLDDPATGYIGGFSQTALEALLTEMRTDYAAWANGFASAMVGESNRYLSAYEFTQMLLQLRADVASAALNATLNSDYRAEVSELRTPLFVITARHDPAVPAPAARWLAEHGSARKLMNIDVRGHLPHVTAPEKVNVALLECLREIDRA